MLVLIICCQTCLLRDEKKLLTRVSCSFDRELSSSSGETSDRMEENFRTEFFLLRMFQTDGELLLQLQLHLLCQMLL